MTSYEMGLERPVDAIHGVKRYPITSESVFAPLNACEGFARGISRGPVAGSSADRSTARIEFGGGSGVLVRSRRAFCRFNRSGQDFPQQEIQTGGLKMPFGIKNTAKISSRSKRSNDTREDRLAKAVDEAGYIYCGSFDIGQDSVTLGVHSVVWGQSKELGTYADWRAIDWSLNPNDSRGVMLNHGHYSFPTEHEVVEDAKARADEALADFSWVKPGTQIPVTGSRSKAAQDYTLVSSRGHQILALYRDPFYDDLGKLYNVVAISPDTKPGVIWGRNYNLDEGFWATGDYNVDKEFIDQRVAEQHLVLERVDYPGLEKALKGYSMHASKSKSKAASCSKASKSKKANRSKGAKR